MILFWSSIMTCLLWSTTTWMWQNMKQKGILQIQRGEIEAQCHYPGPGKYPDQWLFCKVHCRHSNWTHCFKDSWRCSKRCQQWQQLSPSGAQASTGSLLGQIPHAFWGVLLLQNTHAYNQSRGESFYISNWCQPSRHYSQVTGPNNQRPFGFRLPLPWHLLWFHTKFHSPNNLFLGHCNERTFTSLLLHVGSNWLDGEDFEATMKRRFGHNRASQQRFQDLMEQNICRQSTT